MNVSLFKITINPESTILTIKYDPIFEYSYTIDSLGIKEFF